MKNIITNYNGLFNLFYYLRIESGSGHGDKNMGGTYAFVGGYFAPHELEKRGKIVLDRWCDKNNLPYVTADSFDELVEKLKKINRFDTE